MLSRTQLRRLARERLRDAEVLLAGRRYRGAVYLCGYAVEIALKARVCATLRWDGYPETRKEFEGFQSFKTHDLEILLKLSGRSRPVRIGHLADWSVVVEWSPESRYDAVTEVGRVQAESMTAATRALLRVL